MEEFKDLERLHGVVKSPFIRSAKDEQPDPNTFANLSRDVYTSDLPPFEINYSLINDIRARSR